LCLILVDGVSSRSESERENDDDEKAIDAIHDKENIECFFLRISKRSGQRRHFQTVPRIPDKRLLTTTNDFFVLYNQQESNRPTNNDGT
jgi:hypothetical protein